MRIDLLSLDISFLSLSSQPSRHVFHLVLEPTQVYQIPHLHPLQMAHNQDHLGSPSAHHGGPFPLLHAWLHGQEALGGMKKLPYPGLPSCRVQCSCSVPLVLCGFLVFLFRICCWEGLNSEFTLLLPSVLGRGKHLICQIWLLTSSSSPQSPV